MEKSVIKKSEVVTQIDKVLWHLQTYGTLTTWEAFNTYRIMRLGSIINILRNRENYFIETELIEHTLASDILFPNARDGKGQHAKYLYKEPHNYSIGIPAFVKSTSVEKETIKSFLNKLFLIRK
jgi:hypothetical protein